MKKITSMDTAIISDPNIPFQTWRQAIKYGKENFVGKYWNESAQEHISVTVERIRKILGASVTTRSVSKQIHMKAFFQLPTIIKRGKMRPPRACKKGDLNIREMQDFETTIKVNNTDYYVFFTVKAFVDQRQGNNFHYYEVQEMVMKEKTKSEVIVKTPYSGKLPSS